MKKLNINDVIIKPVITEKSSNLLENNVYTFLVHPQSTRDEVKRAVETIFKKSNALVEKVNIIKIGKKSKRLSSYMGYTNKKKKAMVFLKSGSIPIYGAEGVENTEAKKDKKKPLKIIDTDKIMKQAEGDDN